MITADIESSLLKLSDFAKNKAKKETPKKTDRKNNASLFSEEPLNLSKLSPIAIKASAKINKLLLNDEEEFSNLAFTLSTTANELKLNLENIAFHQGTGAAKLSLNNLQDIASLNFNAKLKDIDLGKALKLSDILEAKSDAEISIKSKGNSTAELAKNVNGKANLVAQNGRFELEFLKFLTANIYDVFKKLLGEKDNNPLYCLVASFAIENGKANSKALTLHGSELVVLGEGVIDLIEETIDIGLTTRSNEPSIASLLVPLKITGPLLVPKVSPDIAGTAKELITSPLTITEGVVEDITDVAKKSVGLNSKETQSEYCIEALRKVN